MTLPKFVLDRNFPSGDCGSMRITLAVVAAAFVALGLWLISTGFMSDESSVTTSGPQLTATPQTTAGPVVLGTALLAGGTLFFVLLLRRS